MYIDLPYYKENGGKEMTDAAFSRNEYRARKIVDRFTQGRVKDMQQPPEAVKRLMVELVTDTVTTELTNDTKALRLYHFLNSSTDVT